MRVSYGQIASNFNMFNNNTIAVAKAFALHEIVNRAVDVGLTRRFARLPVRRAFLRCPRHSMVSFLGRGEKVVTTIPADPFFCKCMYIHSCT